MAELVKMPKMSDTMTEGVIASWLKKVGDTVKSGDILAEVETDKATMELESYEDGTLLYIGPKESESVPVDGVLAIIGKKDEDISDLLKGIDGGGGSTAKAAEAPAKEQPKAEAPKEDKQPAEAKTEKKAEAPKAEADADTSDIKASVVTMPKMSDTMTEGTIVSWLKKVGEKVKSGDILAEVETDKATMELEAYEDGTLLYIGVEEGSAVEVDAVLAVIGEQGADYQRLLKGKSAAKGDGGASGKSDSDQKAQEANVQDSREENAKTDEKIESATVSTPPSGSVSDQAQGAEDGKAEGEGRGRIFASPLARKLAEEKGYKLADIKGSGESGRIIQRDVEGYQPAAKQAAKPQAAPAAAPAQATPSGEPYKEVAVSQMRKIIAKRLAESKFSAPHFYLTMEIDMDKAMAARASINEISPVKVSFNDLVIKAAAAALRQHPGVNSSWLGDKIRYNNQINIGVAVAVEEGLLVPVVRNADQKSLSAIAAEVKDLGGKAKSKKLQPSDWEGNTFTISNLGMFGIDEFTAIINPPDACILAVGGIKETPVVRNGEIKIGNVMKVTLSCDHRVVDGAVGSAFLQTLRNLLQDPVRILV
jgi:pyruvate dehydrogenase E2 component (dihydrolipoamide acetyltransferase)